MQGNTIVAKRDKHGFYHVKCAPQDAQPFTPNDEEDPYDPELVRRACIECGRWILDGKRWDAYMEYMEVRQKA
jgi:hypothetical protein